MFSLGEWSPLIPKEFHVFCGTRDTFKRFYLFIYGAITLFGQPFQIVLLR